MDDVAADVDAEITADGARVGLQRLGLAQHLARGLDDVGALPHHGDHRTGHHVVDEAGEEGLAGEVAVVLLKVLSVGTHQLEGEKLVASVLEAADNARGQVALHAVRLDHQESSLLSGLHL